MSLGRMGGRVLGTSPRQFVDATSGQPRLSTRAVFTSTLFVLATLLLFVPNVYSFVTAGSAAVSVVATSPSPTRTPKCDRMFISSPDGARNGSFAAPILRNPEKFYHQCIYTFIAAENERVQIRFTHFSLRGSPPECNHEYLDLYTEVAEPSTELIKSPFGGRYCGRIVPRRRISMHRTLVIGFYTDETKVDGEVFQGTYEFLNASQYVVGTPTPNTVCSFTIYSDRKREGDIMAPTYPGTYPKNLQCQYRFLGRKGQRVRLEFMDFDLFYGGAHCPFDVVKVYDGATTEAPPIGTFCGQQRNLVVYSSAENLLVLFNTLQRTADSQNRGFSGQFEFSERFVNLGFIGKNDGEHIRGTECDQKILSRKESNGTVYSPNYPFLYHPNIVCRYYIYGLQDAQYLEKVRVDFEIFEIQSNDQECTEGYLKIYLQGQEERSAVDEFDHVFCGQQMPPSVESEGPRLMMVFSSGASQGRGFKAHYTFETDYKVPGTASPDGTCHFTYTSESGKTGDFNSPRYPANYPCNSHCEYFFAGLPGEQIKFVFNYFRTKTAEDIIGYNEQCTEDWLEIYELFPSGREHKMGRYCAKTAPGPIVSDQGVNAMKVILFTNDEGVASGFSATYNFLPTMSKFGDCGQNISGVQNGMVTTPGFPANYESHRQICNWYITVRANHKVVLNFEYFLIEGDPSSRGCPGAVVRIWRDLVQPPTELCGETLNNDSRMIISASNVLKLSFITADKAVGSGGFKAIWTEVKDPVTKCDGFVCKVNGFCIPESLKCNRLMNCGFMDDSDEYNCVHPVGLNIYLVAGLSTGSAALATMIVCVLCHRKRRRRRKKRRHAHVPPPFEPPRHQKSLSASPREIPGMHFISVDSV